MLLTIFRAQTILFIPEMEMFGGIAPDGWFGPCVSDLIIGLLVPVLVFLVLRSRSIKVWSLLVLYKALGAFDYSPVPSPEHDPRRMVQAVSVGWGGTRFFAAGESQVKANELTQHLRSAGYFIRC
ncbi:MAG: hypothetical protein AAGA28_04300 [Pseudomonadota bacterium]